MSNEIPSNPLKTIIVITIGFAAIGTFADQKWALYVALAVGGVGFLFPWGAKQIELIWFAIAKVMGYIVPNILLTVIFYCALFPMAMLSRLFKKTDALRLLDKYESMYFPVEEEFDKSSFERPF